MTSSSTSGNRRRARDGDDNDDNDVVEESADSAAAISDTPEQSNGGEQQQQEQTNAQRQKQTGSSRRGKSKQKERYGRRERAAPLPPGVTSANSMTPGARERQRQAYNPFDKNDPAPLEPETFMNSIRYRDGKPLTFDYDDQTPLRTVMRKNIHGEVDTLINEDDFDVPESHKKRIKKHDFLNDTELDEELEAERIAAYMVQPEPVLAQFRKDVRNPRFIAAKESKTIRGAHSTHYEQARPVEASTVKINTGNMHSKLVDKNPDFMTRMQGYDGINPAIEKRRAARESRRKMQELVEFAEREGLTAPGLDEQTLGAGDDDAAAAAAARDEERTDVGLTISEAKRLLDKNPLSMLRNEGGGDTIMRFAEARAVYSTLYPIIMQHEQHRMHYNIAELIGELAVHGIKYDGHVNVYSTERLGALLHPDFYRPFIADNGRLMGGHEHYIDERTSFCVLKFYLVQRTKENAAALQVVDRKGRAMKPRKIEYMADQMKLNAEGLFDIDSSDIDRDREAFDTYSAMHDVKNLERYYMLSVRVVCVVCEKDRDDSDDDHSEEEDTESSPQREIVALEDADDDSGDLDVEEQPSEHRVVQRREDEDQDDLTIDVDDNGVWFERPRNPSVREEDGDGDDDDDGVFNPNDEEDPPIVAEAKHNMPRERLTLDLRGARRLVGKPRAAIFKEKLDNRTFGRLCIRSFLFYPTDAPDEPEK